MDSVKSHIETMCHLIELAKKIPEKAIDESYHFIKQIAPYYYDGEYMVEDYNNLLYRLRRIEKISLSSRNILEFHQLFDPKNPPNGNDLLDYIVWQGRKELIDEKHMEKEDPTIDLYTWEFANMCFFCSKEIEITCNKLGIECHLICIAPGFDPSVDLNSYFKFHYFNIIKYNQKYYLIDVTLPQFFQERYNHPGKLGVVGIDGPDIGCYMMHLKRGPEIAMKLFTDGYIELDEETFKTYMDSFTLSFRNAIYYEENDNIFPYSIRQYRRFLNGKDSQANHEKTYCLGIQTRPLKNPDIKIWERF